MSYFQPDSGPALDASAFLPAVSTLDGRLDPHEPYPHGEFPGGEDDWGLLSPFSNPMPLASLFSPVDDGSMPHDWQPLAPFAPDTLYDTAAWQAGLAADAWAEGASYYNRAGAPATDTVPLPLQPDQSIGVDSRTGSTSPSTCLSMSSPATESAADISVFADLRTSSFSSQPPNDPPASRRGSLLELPERGGNHNGKRPRGRPTKGGKRLAEDGQEGIVGVGIKNGIGENDHSTRSEARSRRRSSAQNSHAGVTNSAGKTTRNHVRASEEDAGNGASGSSRRSSQASNKRAATAKSRAKMQEVHEQMKVVDKAVTLRNAELVEEERHLRQQVYLLKTELLRHANHSALIQQYLRSRAEEIIAGVESGKGKPKPPP